jgi:hypothetical protein
MVYPRYGEVHVKYHAKIVIFLILLAMPFVAQPAQAQWALDGSPVSEGLLTQDYCQAISDGAGGMIVAWQDSRGTYLGIYAQKIDAYGNQVWTTDGVAICTADGMASVPFLCSDGAGGAIIVWEDYRAGNWDTYAQKIDADGATQWAENGIGICTNTSYQDHPRLVPDGSGGAVIVWADDRNGEWDIFVQSISSSGLLGPGWFTGGLPVCTEAGDQYSPVIIENGLGGTIVAWRDDRTGASSIYAQMLDSASNRLWASSGVACDAVNTIRSNPRLISDGYGGAIVTWRDGRGIDYNIYAQHIDVGGNILWGTNAMTVCTATGHQYTPEIVTDGLHGSIITWKDNRITDNDIYAQKLDPNGNSQWGPNGTAICAVPGYQTEPRIIADDDGGAIIAWRDSRYGDADMFIQHIDTDGTILWMAGGASLSTVSPEEQTRLSLVPDGEGGAIAAWVDQRGSISDIYGQRFERNGLWGYPAPDVTQILDTGGDQGRSVMVVWQASRLDLQSPGYILRNTIWRGLPPAMVEQLVAEDKNILDRPQSVPGSDGQRYYFKEVAGTTYGWEYMGEEAADGGPAYFFLTSTLYDSSATSDGLHDFMVIAHGDDDFWESEPLSGYSVDNLPPGQPSGAQAEQSYDPEGLSLSWDANTEIDLLQYNIYRSDPDDPTMSRSPGEAGAASSYSLLVSTMETTYFDGEWRLYSGFAYLITAVDRNGNESVADTIDTDAITGDDLPDMPLASYLSQNYPNPFNPVTMIQFGLRESSNVTLDIYDVSGRLIRTLVSGPLEPGIYNEMWDGTDDRGHGVASGVYFYSLRADSFTDRKKMVILR